MWTKLISVNSEKFTEYTFKVQLTNWFIERTRKTCKFGFRIQTKYLDVIGSCIVSPF